MSDVQLEAGIQKWIDGLKDALAHIPETKTLEGHRDYHEKRATAFPMPAPDGVETRDRLMHAPGRMIPYRLYRPKEREERLPLVLYLHGGGFIAGSIATHDLYGYGIAESAGVAVVSIAYRLAPENPYPAAIEDCHFALQWCIDQAELLGIDPERIAVAGDSAGGALTASLALLLRERGGPRIRLQCLICAALDSHVPVPAEGENKDPFSPHTRLQYFWDSYLQGRRDLDDPIAVPMRAKDLAGLPPAFVLTPEYHLLREEGVRYGERLRAAGVPTEIRVVPGTMHTFLRARFVSALAEAEFQHLCKVIREHLEV
jgi:acetyl esterase